MAGYIDGFTSINGELVDAPLFDQEYAALGAAFDNAAGHRHDGTVAEGGLVPLISDSVNLNEIKVENSGNQIIFSINDTGLKTSQFAVIDGAIVPTLTNDIDLGSLTNKFKDAHLTTVALGTGVAADSILDDDLMTADSATALVTQQSVVAYTNATATSVATAIVNAATIDGGAY